MSAQVQPAVSDHVIVHRPRRNVELALLLTGYVSAKLGGADPGRAIVRNMLVASLAMTTTYLLGTVFAG